MLRSSSSTRSTPLTYCWTFVTKVLDVVYFNFIVALQIYRNDVNTIVFSCLAHKFNNIHHLTDILPLLKQSSYFHFNNYDYFLDDFHQLLPNHVMASIAVFFLISLTIILFEWRQNVGANPRQMTISPSLSSYILALEPAVYNTTKIFDPTSGIGRN